MDFAKRAIQRSEPYSHGNFLSTWFGSVLPVFFLSLSIFFFFSSFPLAFPYQRGGAAVYFTKALWVPQRPKKLFGRGWSFTGLSETIRSQVHCVSFQLSQVLRFFFFCSKLDLYIVDIYINTITNI